MKKFCDFSPCFMFTTKIIYSQSASHNNFKKPKHVYDALFYSGVLVSIFYFYLNVTFFYKNLNLPIVALLIQILNHHP